jgi:hypothetical protein
MPYTPTDYLPYDFANRRHIGPSPQEMVDMLGLLGLETLEALIAETVPDAILQAEPLSLGRGKSEREMLLHLRQVSAKKPGSDVAHRAGLSRHHHPAGDPAQRAGKPRLVHRLHPISAGDQPGPARGAAELPDHGQRSDRAAGGPMPRFWTRRRRRRKPW